MKKGKHKPSADTGSHLARSSPVARRLLLHLYSIGGTDFPKPWRIDPFEKPGAAITWVKAGLGRLRLDESQWNLEPGPCFLFYSTDQTRRFIPDPGKTLVARSFWFSGPGLDGWLEELDIRRRPQFCLRHPERIYAAYRAMKKLVDRRPPNWEWRVHLLLVSVLGEFLASRKLLSPQPDALPPMIMRVMNAVESDPARDWKASELAAIARMSYSGLRTLFRAAMNETPHDYLQRVRMDLAREMLADPKLRMKEIAGKLHFSSEYYFSSFFRKHAGMSPTEFRQTGKPKAP